MKTMLSYAALGAFAVALMWAAVYGIDCQGHGAMIAPIAEQA